ncbi:MAG TPA: alpha/beta hydrolase [Bdellovibrionales bacterium]|nr:alpha/beta hydrolase [Bdellovibrionales bacterium]
MRTLLALFTLSLVVSVASPVRANPAASAELPDWFRPAGRPKAVILVAHGLNLLPSRMNYLSRRLAENGYEVFRTKLEGHGDSLDVFKGVRRETWLREMRDSAQIVRARAGELGLDSHFVGYSVGALVYQDLISQDPALALQKHVYFAPALAPRSRNKLVRLLKLFGPRFCLKSFAPENYRAHGCTPLAAYDALFASAETVAINNFAAVNRPSLAFVDPLDELVSYNDLKRLIATGPLSKWRLIDVSTAGSTLPRPWHHLIIDDAAVGAGLWRQIELAMLEFLR